MEIFKLIYVRNETLFSELQRTFIIKVHYFEKFDNIIICVQMQLSFIFYKSNKNQMKTHTLILVFAVIALAQCWGSYSNKNDITGNFNKIRHGSENSLWGSYNDVAGNRNGIEGSFNGIRGNANQIRGNGNGIIGNHNFAAGHGNGIYGSSNGVAGSWNKIAGNYNGVVGNENSVIGHANGVFGNRNNVYGHANGIKGNKNNVWGVGNSIGFH